MRSATPRKAASRRRKIITRVGCHAAQVAIFRLMFSDGIKLARIRAKDVLYSEGVSSYSPGLPPGGYPGSSEVIQLYPERVPPISLVNRKSHMNVIASAADDDRWTTDITTESLRYFVTNLVSRVECHQTAFPKQVRQARTQKEITRVEWRTYQCDETAIIEQRAKRILPSRHQSSRRKWPVSSRLKTAVQTIAPWRVADGTQR